MSMTVRRTKDSRTARVIMHRVADIRGGVSVATAELGGDYLPEGAVLSAPVDGICHVVKTATAAAAATADATTLKVKKGHLFAVGDAIMAKEGGTAVTISAIDGKAKDADTLTLSAALGAVAAGAAVMQAAAAGAKGALKYEPFAIVGTGRPVGAGINVDTDAWVMAVTKGNALPEAIAAKLKGIINY